ncbi:hypothetical protein [Brevundimonas subvibrioides]|uniref:hypothetical protein n=1 Tax=Brevundimonas subvibrioides TaxID=74313 RepID=UPI0022B59916|nr:hypothetical protein [Brevundimonas subvibrioides]
MVWGLRICLGALVLAYAAWLGLPLVEALSAGTPPMKVWANLAQGESPMGLTFAGLFMATILLYGLGGIATAARLNWAPGLYFAGFLGEITLRLAGTGAGQPLPSALDIAARADVTLRPFGVLVETTPLVLAALLAVGLCILAMGVWRGQKGAALTHIWTRPPVWA